MVAIADGPRRNRTAWRPYTFILASAVVNLGLLLVYETARDGQWMSSAVRIVSTAIGMERAEPAASLVPLVDGTVALGSATLKGDLPFEERERKGSLTVTVVRQSVESQAALSPVQAQPVTAEPGGQAAEENMTDASSSSGGEQGIAPILLRDQATGALRIGYYKSITVPDDGDLCLEMGHGMLEDAGADSDLLDVLAATDDITITRICASNGSITLTCRNGNMVISSRKSRPSDSCAS